MATPSGTVATMMTSRKWKTTSPGLAAAAFVAFALGLCATASTQEQGTSTAAVQSQIQSQCAVDLARVGHMKDVLSNALIRGLKVQEREVGSFLSGAETRYPNGPDLLKAAAQHFKRSEADLAAQVAKFKHVNCKHVAASGVQDQQNETAVSTFAKNVTLNVVLHEIGHALIREFDIPVLANEETTADAFANYYLTTYMPDRAAEILTARVTSLMVEAGEETRIDWSGEHDHDARRAYQIAALAIAADRVRYKPVAAVVNMSEDDIKDAADYGAEILRSWRRQLTSLSLPNGVTSREARVVYDAKNEFLRRLCDDGLARDVEAILKRFDWHSQVTVTFVEGEGKAGWSRSSRTVTVHSKYVRRFIEQGRRLPK